MRETNETGKAQDEAADSDNSPTPAEVLDWIRVWLTHPNRDRSKFSDIAIVVLTVVIAAFAGWSAWIFEANLARCTTPR